MRKGIICDNLPDENKAIHSTVWKIAMRGDQRDPMFKETFYSLKPDQRGIVFQPFFDNGKNEYDIASAHYELLTENNPSWNNGIPIIVDIWGGKDRFNFDNIMVYLSYSHSRYDFKVKPLLKVTAGLWNGWYKDNPTESSRLLNLCELLLVHPKSEYPNQFEYLGTPTWWEYDWGYIAHDKTKMFEGVNVSEIPNSSIVTPPVIIEEEPIEIIEQLPQWKVLARIGNYMLVKIE